MRAAVPIALIIASLVAMSVVTAGVASALALARADVERLDADLAPFIGADYAADLGGRILAPLDEGIIDAAREDDDSLREASEVRIVPVFFRDPPEDGDSAPDPTPSPTPTDGDSTPEPTPTPTSVDPAPNPTPTDGDGAPDPIPNPSSVSLTSVADSYVDQNQPAANYGTTSRMRVRASATGKNQRSFVLFDPSSIPAGATINSATLTLCAENVPRDTRTYNVNRVNASWAETALTWNNQPALTVQVTDSATTPTSAGCMSWTVTADVQAWVDGAENNGWRVSDSAAGKPNHMTPFRTREDSVTAERPTLDISYTSQ